MEIIKEILKENYIKNVKEFYKIKKEIEKTTENYKKAKNDFDDIIEKYLKKEIQADLFLQYEKENKANELKYKKAFDILNIKKALIQNNLYNLINYDFKKIIYNDIFYKYTCKNIGDKTKQKMIDEIKAYYKNNYNIDIYFYFIREYNYKGELFNINFDINIIDTEKRYNNDIVKYSTCLYIDNSITCNIAKDLLKIKYNELDAHFVYNYDENFAYNIIENINEEAQKIYKTTTKNNEKIKKIIEDFETTKKANNEMLRNNLYNIKNLYINSYINKY
jgi:hypothetical protein